MERNNSLTPHFNDSCFASEGHEKAYDWFAYANFYSSTIHKMSIQLESENQRISPYDEIRKRLYNTINNSERFAYKVKNPFVVNTTVFAPGGSVLREFVEMLSNFFDTTKIVRTLPNGANLLEIYRGKDLILPLLYCDNNALEFIEEAAPYYIEKGAKSVTIIFIYRIKPDLNNTYPDDSEYPPVTEYNFAQTLNLSGNGNFLSQLADAAEYNYKNQEKYKLLK